MKSEKITKAGVIILLLATQFLVAVAFAQTRPAVELEGAIAKEQVDGDLKTAIPAYQKVAAESSAPRDVGAKALLHLARCYEKLGQQAQTVYQQVVRDFADQPEATQARMRLLVLMRNEHPAAPETMAQRKIENPGPESLDPRDTDGHHMVYQDASGELIYGDLSGKNQRVIYRAKSGDPPLPFPSRDFSKVLLVLHPYKPDEQQTIAVVNTYGTGYREIAHMNAQQYGCWHWSWDDRYVLLCGDSPGKGLLRICVADGQTQELVSLKAGIVSAAQFSPDGRFIAYQVPATSDADSVSQIFIRAADGSKPWLVYEERPTDGHSQSFRALRLLDWTSDGRFLAIASDRTGKGVLHLLPIRDGKAAGAPVFVQYGAFEGGVTTSYGGLVYSSVRPGGVWAVYLTSLDSDDRPGDWKQLDLRLGGNIDMPAFRWSSDSRQIVYVAKSEDLDQLVVHLYNLSTGEDREVYHARGDPTCTWAAQQPKLFCIDTAETTEIFSMAVDSGEIARLHTFPVPRELRILYPSRDDRALYMYEVGADSVWKLLRWEIATKRERILERYPPGTYGLSSPNERWLVRRTGQKLQIRPTSGGDWKPLAYRKDFGIAVLAGQVKLTPTATGSSTTTSIPREGKACSESLPPEVRRNGWATSRRTARTALWRSARTRTKSSSPLATGSLPTNYGYWKILSLRYRSGRRIMKSEKMQNIAVAILAATQLPVAVAFAQTRPAVELEGASAKEQVEGDLKTAIVAYQKIAAESSAPRDVRAKALIHLARCYENLGQQAQTVYQQIVRDFADQPEATQARARLAALKQDDHATAPSTMTQRKIENPGRGSLDPRDTDGRHVVYQNATGELIYSDLARKTKQVIFKAKLNDFPWWFPSRDFSKVLLVLHPYKHDEQQTVAVVNTDGTGYREIAHIDAIIYGSGAIFPGCWNWSWDSRYVLLCGQSEEDGNSLLRISVADGQIHELLSLKTGTLNAAQFSPDGPFVAYGVTGREPARESIFVLPIEGGEPQLIYEEQQASRVFRYFKSLKLLDWTADGRHLAIANERTGKGALDLLPIRDGKSAGSPVLVKYGDFEAGVTTAAGELVYSSVKPGGLWSVYLASLDAQNRPSDWKCLDLHLGNFYNPWPKWSGDGTQIVYVAKSEDTGETGDQIVRLHNVGTGEDRAVYRTLRGLTCTWAVQQPKLFCIDVAEKTEILSIAIDSGEITRLHILPARFLILCPSRDDRALYMFRGLGNDETEVLRCEIATGQETILEHDAARAVSVSQDAHWLIRYSEESLAIHPTSGGDWKSLGCHSDDANHLDVTPDGNWVFYHDVHSTGKDSLFRIATSGGTPERLGDFPTKAVSGTMEISPNGAKIIVSAGEFATGYELWSLENFLPSAPKR